MGSIRKNHPVARWIITVRGTELTRDFYLGQSMPKDAPPWLENATREWDHPMDPVTIRGTCKRGMEEQCLTDMGAAW